MGNEKTLQLFTYEGNTLRTVVIGEEIWFLAVDVCNFLELKNVSQATSRIKGKHKTTITTNDSGSNYKHLSLCVNEPGLYHLLFTSRKAEAEAFQDWVYEEVLPSIRKTGGYSMQQRVPEKPAPTFSDVLRQRAFLNEGRVPLAFFSTQGESVRELRYVEGFLNETLDNQASLENSVGKCFSFYARNTLHLPDSERRKYRHQLPNGRVVGAWAYPIKYLPDFRQWLYEIYFPVKYAAYRRYRTRRLGIAQALLGGPNTPQKRIVSRRGEQLLLFSSAAL